MAMPFSNPFAGSNPLKKQTLFQQPGAASTANPFAVANYTTLRTQAKDAVANAHGGGASAAEIAQARRKLLVDRKADSSRKLQASIQRQTSRRAMEAGIGASEVSMV